MSQEGRDDPVVERLIRIEDRLTRVEDDVAVLKSDVAMLKGDVAVLKSDVAWLKRLYKSLDYRVWFILAGVVVTILMSLLR